MSPVNDGGRRPSLAGEPLRAPGARTGGWMPAGGLRLPRPPLTSQGSASRPSPPFRPTTRVNAIRKSRVRTAVRNSSAHVALGGVVGGRHASHRQEDPQRRPTDAPVVAQPGRFAMALLQSGAQALLNRGQRLRHRQPCRWRLLGCFQAAPGAVDRRGRTVRCLAVAGGGVAVLDHRLGIALQVRPSQLVPRVRDPVVAAEAVAEHGQGAAAPASPARSCRCAYPLPDTA